MISVFKIMNQIWPEYIYANERHQKLRRKNEIDLKKLAKHAHKLSIF